MTNFQRNLDSEVIARLKNDPLFAKLKVDCEKGDVFPAVRRDYMSFYYKGGSLFEYKARRFSTDIKYGIVPRGKDKDRVTEQDLANFKIATDFEVGYEKIQKRCEKYNANSEAAVVSKLYKDSPMATNGKSNRRYYLVDIEVAFPGRKNQIDILLYDNTTQRLLFCEAKHYSNEETRAQEGDPPIVKQLERYNTQIEKSKTSIIGQYGNHFGVLKSLFGIELNPPEKVYPYCGLLLFGFDDDQKRGPLMEKRLSQFSGHKYYAKGGIDGISAETLFKCLTDECRTNRCGSLCWRKKQP